jgi:hypothetical protein
MHNCLIQLTHERNSSLSLFIFLLHSNVSCIKQIIERTVTVCGSNYHEILVHQSWKTYATVNGV